MKAVICAEFGDESVLKLQHCPSPECGPEEVLIKTSSTSVNRADLLQRQGFYPPPEGASVILGLEAAGEIIEVGKGVQGYQVGEEVMALLTGGGYCERVVASEGHVMKVPGSVSRVDAGAIPEVFLTAFLNLVVLGQMKPKERILIHGGSGGVGTAAIQLARILGAEVWTTCGSDERAEKCVGLGAHRALNYRKTGSDGETPLFAEAIRAVGGANLILDVVGAKYLNTNIDALATGGRLVVIGLLGGVKGTLNLGRLLTIRGTILGSTLRSQSILQKSALIGRFKEEVWPLLDNGQIAPIIDRYLPIESVAEAHGIMARGEQFGKLVLTF
jgi:putative PIG3 family NAD(P)H quinone oxidoreductase